MQPPFVLDEHGDISIFRNLDHLLSYVEPIDVINGEYEVFDSEGRRIALSAAKKVQPLLFGLITDETYSRVWVDAIEESPEHRRTPTRRLAAALGAAADVDLPALIAHAINRFGFER